MTATTFNPLATARDLKAAGIEAEHAEAIAEGMREAADAAADAGRSDLATKADIADLKADMLKVAIGVAIGVVIANATLTAVLVFGALRLLQP